MVAGSSSTAAETIKKQWEPIWISNLRVISERDSDWQNGSSSSSSSSSEVTPGMYWFVGFVLLLYVLVTYWYVVLPVLLVAAVLVWRLKR